MRRVPYERKRKPRPEVIKVAEHNWPQLIHELQRAGYSKTSIEAATGLSKERIDSLICYRAAEPLWSHGEALLKFVYQLRQEKEENESE